jgi:hypothetical protein
MKMEAARSSETSANTYQTKWCQIPERCIFILDKYIHTFSSYCCRKCFTAREKASGNAGKFLLEYLHRGPASHRMRREGNIVPGYKFAALSLGDINPEI